VQDLDEAGGIPAVMAELNRVGLIDGGVETLTGKTVAQNLEGVDRTGSVIRPIDDPHSASGGMAVLWGNLAPDGAVVKARAVSPTMVSHQGRARVFDEEESAMEAILGGDVAPGDVVVIRYEGPRGAG
jgi:dihydroxy-acid dehydratase